MIEMKSLAGKEQKKIKAPVVILCGALERLYIMYFKP